MKEFELITELSKILHVNPTSITNIRPTPGGLTNKSYFVTINDEKLVVRVPGVGTDELVCREFEKANLQLGIELGIHPPLIYFDESTGFKITKKIVGAIPITPSIARDHTTMLHIIQLFKHLHQSNASMKNDFELFAMMQHYEKIVGQVNKIKLEKIAQLRKEVKKLQAVYESLDVKKAPCHIDAAASNILLSSEHDTIYLIDWEYSGMFDPFWDIATLFISLQLEKEEQTFFLMHYLGRQPNEEELLRIMLHSIFQDYLWALWSIYKEAKGDDAGGDFPTRFKRAMENLSLYNELFGKNIVI